MAMLRYNTVNWIKKNYDSQSSSDQKITEKYVAYLDDQTDQIAAIFIQGEKQTGIKNITFTSHSKLINSLYEESCMEAENLNRSNHDGITLPVDDKRDVITLLNYIEKRLPGIKNAIFNNLTLQQLSETIGFYDDIKKVTGSDSLNFNFDTFHVQVKSATDEVNFLHKIQSALSQEVKKTNDYLAKATLHLKAEIFNNTIFSSDSIGKMKALLMEGHSIDSVDARGFTALRMAVVNNKFNEAEFLLQQGAYSNIADNAGTTPLLAAAEYGYVEFAKLLIQFGAKVNGDSQWRTPSYRARKNGFENLAIAIETNTNSAWATAVEEYTQRKAAKLVKKAALDALIRERNNSISQQNNVISITTEENSNVRQNNIVNKVPSL